MYVCNSNICLSETAYQHKGTRRKCKKTNQAAIIQWQRQCLMDKPHRKPWPKSKISLSRVPVHCITPFCSDALVSPPNLYPPWIVMSRATFDLIHCLLYFVTPALGLIQVTQNLAPFDPKCCYNVRKDNSPYVFSVVFCDFVAFSVAWNWHPRLNYSVRYWHFFSQLPLHQNY